MDVSAYNALVTPHIAWVKRTTLPLCGEVQGIEDQFGTGVLLAIGKSVFMLTVRHVPEKTTVDGLDIYIGTATADTPHVGLKGEFLSSKDSKSLGDVEPDPFDVAIVRLATEFAERVLTYANPITFDKVELMDDKLAPGRYLLYGYPSAFTERDDELKEVSSGCMPYITHTYEGDRAPTRFDSTRHLIINYQFEGHLDELGNPSIIPAFGMSGSGVWRLMDKATPIERINGHQIKLAGIAHEWDSSARVIRATRINYYIETIDRRFPDLDSEFRRYFPRTPPR
jgi:hypothetical protein